MGCAVPEEAGEDQALNDQGQQGIHEAPAHAQQCPFVLLFEIPGRQLLKEKLVSLDSFD